MAYFEIEGKRYNYKRATLRRGQQIDLLDWKLLDTLDLKDDASIALAQSLLNQFCEIAVDGDPLNILDLTMGELQEIITGFIVSGSVRSGLVSLPEDGKIKAKDA